MTPADAEARWRLRERKDIERYGDMLERIFAKSAQRVATALRESDRRLRSKQRALLVDKDTVIMRGRRQASDRRQRGAVEIDDRS